MRLKLKKGGKMNNENLPKKLSMKAASDNIFIFCCCCLSIQVFECDKSKTLKNKIKTSMTLVEKNMVCDKFNSVKHKHGGFRHEGLQYRYELLLHIPYEAYFVEITISK